MNHTATYSPEDNKLRLYPACRLSTDEYAKVKAAGFSWAPKQELFVAPMWTPAREDLLLEMCGGEVGDEDRSLVDRAEERAERFEDYSQSRRQDAEQAHAAVERITDGIPLGQPILVGHHSEKHARKDAERIESGMRKAVQMWKTSEYWTARAAGALKHAKYKELPAVRYRRIKGIEADKRKEEKYKQAAEDALKLWQGVARQEDKEKQLRQAVFIAGHEGGSCRLLMPRKEGDRPDFDQRPDAYSVLTSSYPNLYAPRTIEEVLEVALSSATFPAAIARYQRWIDHYANRLAYERAMLNEDGGLKGEGFAYEVGGRVLRRGEWLPVLKVNKRGGVVQSVSVAGHFASTVSVDEIREYRAPAEGEKEKVKAVLDKGPMCNYPGEGFKHMTTDEWKRKRMSDVPQAETHKAGEKWGKHRTRATWGGNWQTVCVYLTDSKRIDPPAAEGEAKEPVRFERIREPQPLFNHDVQFTRATDTEIAEATSRETVAKKIEELKVSLAAGVKVVTAPQLFPTPAGVVERMMELAEVRPGMRVLEPSAGTGNIVKALPTVRPDGEVVAVEISSSLLYLLEPYADEIVCGDFLQQNGNLGKFDRVLMNPPFENGADIKHIKHAVGFLKPGGRLVAVCAGGSRQREQLGALVEQYGGEWEDLPEGTFKEQGTGVRTVLISLTVPTEA